MCYKWGLPFYSPHKKLAYLVHLLSSVRVEVRGSYDEEWQFGFSKPSVSGMGIASSGALAADE